PENILLTRRGEVKITDFGLSRMMHSEEAQRLTQTGMTIGTPLYMSPEQVEGRALDIRSDIYSLGVTCYHLLAGRPPFEGENAFAVALQHVQAEPPSLKLYRPDLPDEVCALIHQMLAKRPEDRFQSPAELLRAVVELQERFLDSSTPTIAITEASTESGGSSSAAALSQSTRTWSVAAASRRTLGRWLGGLAAMALSLVAAFWGGWFLGKHWFGSAASDDEKGPSEVHPDFPALRGVWGVTAREQEEALMVLVRVTERPEKDPIKLRQGVQHRVDLAVLLLRSYGEDRMALDRAERLFREWAQSPVEAYGLLGEIGLAMVLAFRDQATESNERFLGALKRSPGLQRPAFGLTPFLQPEWYRLVVRALEHNYINCRMQQLPFPNELARLRQDLPAKPRAAKPSG
ncbi:MAG: serine/threonine-protein kinase, partial [Gemmatales bacterium]|nr:protein kinase [Gemmatales bacterium]MDW8176817.1 serine/threonine-protein kinase [Gemmatales bacterium]